MNAFLADFEGGLLNKRNYNSFQLSKTDNQGSRRMQIGDPAGVYLDSYIDHLDVMESKLDKRINRFKERRLLESQQTSKSTHNNRTALLNSTYHTMTTLESINGTRTTNLKSTHSRFNGKINKEASQERTQLYRRAISLLEQQKSQYRRELKDKYQYLIQKEIETIQKIPTQIANDAIKQTFIKLRHNVLERTIQSQMLKQKGSNMNINKVVGLLKKNENTLKNSFQIPQTRNNLERTSVSISNHEINKNRRKTNATVYEQNQNASALY